MTLGAAALGIVATGAFGYAAALTYSGTATANAADQNGGFDTPAQATPNTRTGTTGGGSSRNSGGTSIAPNVQNQVPVTPPTTTRHRQHAVTGGS